LVSISIDPFSVIDLKAYYYSLLVGFASTGIFGPWIGRLVDNVGRRAGTIAYAGM
jgi:hypothetical protein